MELEHPLASIQRDSTTSKSSKRESNAGGDEVASLVKEKKVVSKQANSNSTANSAANSNKKPATTSKVNGNASKTNTNASVSFSHNHDSDVFDDNSGGVLNGNGDKVVMNGADDEYLNGTSATMASANKKIEKVNKFL